MRPIILAAAFTIVVVAVPLTIEIGEGNHLAKRSSDSLIDTTLKAILVLATFIWGGTTIGRTTVDYYFDRLHAMERERRESERVRRNDMNIT
jgi:hypothetical protein